MNSSTWRKLNQNSAVRVRRLLDCRRRPRMDDERLIAEGLAELDPLDWSDYLHVNIWDGGLEREWWDDWLDGCG